MRTPIIAAASIALFLLVLASFATPLSKTPFSSHGEAREAVVVLDMLEQHNLILPLRNGIDIPSKPPLFHWLAIGMNNLVGSTPDETTIRMPSVLAGALTAALMFILLTSRFGIAFSLPTTLMLLTSFEWARSSSLARVDMVFTLCLTVSFVLIHQIVLRCCQRLRPNVLDFILLGLALGLATLTKGPAGIALAGASGVLFYSLMWWKSTERSAMPLPIVEALLALAIATLVAGWWYYLAFRQGGEAFIAVQLMKENAARVLGMEGYDVGHQRPFYFGIIYLFTGLLPWSILLPFSLYFLWKKRSELFTPDHSLLLFSSLWVMVFLTVISISPSKRIVYFLPTYPALVTIIGFSIPGLSSKASGSLTTRMALNTMITSLLVVGLIFVTAVLLVVFANDAALPNWMVVSPRDRSNIEMVLRTFQNSPIKLFAPLLAAVGLITASRSAMKAGRISACVNFLALAVAALILITSNFIFPVIAEQNSPKTFMAQIDELVDHAVPLKQFKVNTYAAIFYAGRDLGMIEDVASLESTTEYYLLTREQYLDQLMSSETTLERLKTSSPRACEGSESLSLLHYKPPA